MRAAAAEPRFLTAVGGVVVLAVGVNFVELLCSAGIPAVYTQVIAMTPMPAWQHYAWLGLYVLVFLLDDVGGIVLLVIGALLLMRPDWLRFT